MKMILAVNTTRSLMGNALAVNTRSILKEYTMMVLRRGDTTLARAVRPMHFILKFRLKTMKVVATTFWSTTKVSMESLFLIPMATTMLIPRPPALWTN